MLEFLKSVADLLGFANSQFLLMVPKILLYFFLVSVIGIILSGSIKGWQGWAVFVGSLGISVFMCLLLREESALIFPLSPGLWHSVQTADMTTSIMANTTRLYGQYFATVTEKTVIVASPVAVILFGIVTYALKWSLENTKGKTLANNAKLTGALLVAWALFASNSYALSEYIAAIPLDLAWQIKAASLMV